MKACVFSAVLLACVCLTSGLYIMPSRFRNQGVRRAPQYGRVIQQRPQQQQQPQIIVVQSDTPQTAPQAAQTKPQQPVVQTHTQAPIQATASVQPAGRYNSQATGRYNSQATGRYNSQQNGLDNYILAEALDIPFGVDPAQYLLMNQLDSPIMPFGGLAGTGTGAGANTHNQRSALDQMLLMEHLDYPEVYAF